MQLFPECGIHVGCTARNRKLLWCVKHLLLTTHCFLPAVFSLFAIFLFHSFCFPGPFRVFSVFQPSAMQTRQGWLQSFGGGVNKHAFEIFLTWTPHLEPCCCPSGPLASCALNVAPSNPDLAIVDSAALPLWWGVRCARGSSLRLHPVRGLAHIQGFLSRRQPASAVKPAPASPPVLPSETRTWMSQARMAAESVDPTLVSRPQRDGRDVRLGLALLP